MVKRVVNFNPGPAALPLPALERAQRELLDFEGTGMSIMEHSHRGKDYERVHDEALALLRELFAIPADYQVLLLQGGATMQFALIPFNFLTRGQSADYVITGNWARKAYAEAKWVGDVRIAANVEEEGGVCTRVPRQAELELDPAAAYLHYCTNNTIMGTQFHHVPESGAVPLFADMSSDILSRPVDVSRFSLIYAGAQKNMGPAGVTVVIAKKSLLETGREDIPKIFRYREHAKENSLLNTAPTFSIYMLRNVLAALKERGGVAVAERQSREKAALIYGLLDEFPELYRSRVEAESRSLMNPVFRLPTPELDAKLVADAKAAGFVGIKGHKLIGGIRVSLYNPVEVADVAKFTEWARGFARAHR
jgi:phosphoserine aminotransferase